MNSPDKPWIIRTYAGHTDPGETNELFRKNLNKGQTGLSIAFDLPTQTGYDSDHPLAEAEVGKVGVPVCNLEDMETLFDGIPIEQMNTSMTINATAPWLLALYIALAVRRGVDISKLKGTTQNDIIKEYLSRGTYIFPPHQSVRLVRDMITYTRRNMPKWNPVNICSYHLQEAGATTVQEIAFTICNAIAVLDDVKSNGGLSDEDLSKVTGRISFFLNAGIRFVTEVCKIRAMGDIWDHVTFNRYGVRNPRYRRFRYGVQVNSLGLTARQPENNVARIILQMLGVTLSKSARARAIQLPAWNEALGLPRPWDQQWSLRFQQVLAYETDLLEYEDIFDGSEAIQQQVSKLKQEAWEEISKIDSMGGTLEALEYMKSCLVRSHAERIKAIEKGDIKVVGVNCFTETEESPLTRDLEESVQTIDSSTLRGRLKRLGNYRRKRDENKVKGALRELKDTAASRENIMPPSVRCALSGVTTGEWADTLRDVFGEYRAPTGTNITLPDLKEKDSSAIERVKAATGRRGRPLRILIAKPGLDGHSNGAEQLAVRARNIGMEVVYQGIRLTPEQIVNTAEQEDVDLIGISILSGSHKILIPRIIELLRKKGIDDIPVIAGGIIPEYDIEELLDKGVTKVYTSGSFTMDDMLFDIAGLAAGSELD